MFIFNDVSLVYYEWIENVDIESQSVINV